MLFILGPAEIIKSIREKVELQSSEVLCSLEMVLACLIAPLSYFPLSVLLWYRSCGGFYLTLARDKSQVHCSRPQGESMAWSEPLAMNPCSTALPLSFLTLVFCTLSHSHYLLFLWPVFQGEWQEMCCTRELTPLGETLCKLSATA